MEKMKNNEYKWNWGRELDQYDIDAENHWKQIDRDDANTDWEKIQETSKQNFLNMLKGDLGKEIQDVTTGKVKIKLPFKMKLKYWFKRVFEIFS